MLATLGHPDHRVGVLRLLIAEPKQGQASSSNEGLAPLLLGLQLVSPRFVERLRNVEPVPFLIVVRRVRVV